MRKLLDASLLLLCVFCMTACGNGEKVADNKSDSTATALPIASDTIPAPYVQPPPGADTAFKEFAFIIGDSYIILSSTPDSNWIKGKPALMEDGDGGVYSVTTGVNTDQLPAFYRDQLHKKFRICAKDGSTAVAEIASFKMYSAFIPHFGQVQQWNGNDGSGEKPYTPEQKALDILRSGALYLVAEFKIEKKDEGINNLCFAVPETNTVPLLFPSFAATEENVKKVRSLLLETPAYKEIQKEYVKLAVHADKWWEDETAQENSFFFEGKDGKRYAAMTHMAGEFCGGEFSASRISFWKLGSSAPVMLHMMDDNYSVLLVTDIDCDGEPEFLIDNGFGKHILLKKERKEWTDVYSWNTPYMDCPC